MLKPKEKGQGLIEYALIIVLVAIFITFCVLIASTINEESSSPKVDTGALRNAPIIGTTETHPEHVTLSDADNKQYKEVNHKYGCYKESIDSSYSIRAGTEYADTSVIRIKRLDDSTYSFCVDVKGVNARIVYDLVKNPQ